MARLYGGVEMGGTWVVCALGTEPDDIAEQTEFRTEGPAETIERIVAFFGGRERPAAVGVGAFGPVDLHPGSPTYGFVTTTPKPGWRDVPLAGPLGERLGVPIAFDTDVNAAALAEARWGAGQGCPSLCYLTVGTGIGAGLLRDGRPWHGLIHPEAGHIRVPHDRLGDPFPGSCPQHGDCWEGLASGGAMAERWGVPADRLPGDHEAWELEAGYLALGIYALMAIGSPHRVVLGGGVLEAEGLLDQVRRELDRLNAGYLAWPPLEELVVAAGLGDDAGVLGAIALARELVG